MPKQPTTRGNLPRPSGSDPDYPPDDFTALTDRLAIVAAFDDQGPLSSLPTATAALRGSYYWATDARFLLRCTGDAWVPVIEFPIGGTMIWNFTGTPAAPGTWLECLGQSVLKASYPLLFAAAGVAAASMNLPDFRGRVPAGAGTGTGLTARSLGQTFGTETADAPLPAHTHGVNDPGHSHPSPNGQGFVQIDTGGNYGTGSGFSPRQPGTAASTAGATSGVSIQSAGSGSGTHPNSQPTLVVRYFMRAA